MSTARPFAHGLFGLRRSPPTSHYVALVRGCALDVIQKLSAPGALHLSNVAVVSTGTLTSTVRAFERAALEGADDFWQSWNTELSLTTAEELQMVDTAGYLFAIDLFPDHEPTRSRWSSILELSNILGDQASSNTWPRHVASLKTPNVAKREGAEEKTAHSPPRKPMGNASNRNTTTIEAARKTKRRRKM